jgi:hypothetical protein
MKDRSRTDWENVIQENNTLRRVNQALEKAAERLRKDLARAEADARVCSHMADHYRGLYEQLKG